MEIESNKSFQSDELKMKITNLYLDINADVAKAVGSIDGRMNEGILVKFKTKIIALINIASFNMEFADAIDHVYSNYLYNSNYGRATNEDQLRHRIMDTFSFWRVISKLLREYGLIVIDSKR